MHNTPIDFVVTWVDPSDPKWRADFNHYKYGYRVLPKDKEDIGEERYRDWGLLKYWFRGVEKYAPWVRYVHFVTYGHIPDWLDMSNPKLRIVRHEDYIPKQYLPLFNSNPIELMMHRIPDLAEHFVYFNDDFFLVSPVKREFFFKNGKPCDVAILCNHHANEEIMRGITEQNMKVINKEFNLYSQVLHNPRLWFRLEYDKFILQTISGVIFRHTVAPADTHSAQPYLKSVIEAIWSKYGDKLAETMKHRFRQCDDTSHWLFRYWQIVGGVIEPKNLYRHNKAFYAPENNLLELRRYITSGEKTIVIINDGGIVNDFLSTTLKIGSYFDEILPSPSSFEKGPCQ